MEPSHWVKYLSKTGHIRIVFVEAGEVVQEVIDRHGLLGLACQAAGEITVAGFLKAACHKPGDRINISVKGSGAARHAMVDVYPEGFIRTFVIEGSNNSSNHTETWGQGTLTVLHVKNESGAQPYAGTVPLQTGQLDRDFTHYWFQSEQLTTNVLISVIMKQNTVKRARGILVQEIADADSDDLKTILSFADKMPDIWDYTDSKDKFLSKLNDVLKSYEFKEVEDLKLAFRCNCSQERVERSVALSGVEELQSMVDRNKDLSVRCEFCNDEYTIGVTRLKEILKQATQN